MQALSEIASDEVPKHDDRQAFLCWSLMKMESLFNLPR
jgi:hypothetical protein